MAKVKSSKLSVNASSTQLYYQASGSLKTPLKAALERHGAIPKILTEQSPGSAVHYTPNRTRPYRAVIKKEGFLCVKEATPASQIVKSKVSTRLRTTTHRIITAETVRNARGKPRGTHQTSAADAIEREQPVQMDHAHVIAHCLGGQHEESNFYPATHSANVATYRLCEKHVKEHAKEGNPVHYSVEVRYDLKAVPSVNLTADFLEERAKIYINASSTRKISREEKDVVDAICAWKR